MFSSLLRSLPQLGRRWKPLEFPNPNFVRIPESHKIEEETLPHYNVSEFYPIRIGEVIKERYQVIGKLGFGSTSTAWLARDMDDRRCDMPKIFVQASSMGQQVDNELNMYRSTGHPGREAIRTLLDTFYIDGPKDKHRCLVHPPLWESVLAFLRRNPVERLPSPVLAVVLHRLFLALDYLHTECQITHTDTKADNIMFGIKDDTVFTDFESNELEGRYRSRAHLAEMMNLLGPPPSSLLAQAELRDKFFSIEGDFLTPSLLTGRVPLEGRETTLEGQVERGFSTFHAQNAAVGAQQA